MAIIPILISSTLSFLICYNAILDNSVAVSHEITDYAANEINRAQTIADDIATSMISSSEIQIVMRYDNEDSPTHLITPFHINTSLSLLQRSASSEIVDIYCFNNNGLLYHSNTTSSIDELFIDTYWYQEILDSGGSTWFEPHDTSFISGHDYNTLISYGVTYLDYITQEPNGVILIDINADTLFNNLSNSDALASNKYYVLNENNEILFSTDENSDEITDPDLYFQDLSYSNFYYSHALDNQWKVVGVISGNSIARDALAQLSLLLILLLIIAISLAIAISIKRARQISEPIHTLIQNMNGIHGETSNTVLLIPSSTDEIVALYSSFNIMINNSNRYIAQIKHEQAELRNANFKALQAQINPHFLYNTMDTIAWNIRLDEKEKAISAIMALTKFFRASLRKGSDIINIEQEMEQVSLYLQIQMFRYDDLLEYTIEYDETLKHCILPKLILQPIVENAIYHGIKDKGDYGHIDIRTERFDGYYFITVTDDGLGIEPTRLEELNNLLKHNIPLNSNDSSGYGISNVNERIKIYFGDEYGITFDSILEEYTRVTIKLPIVTNTKEITNSQEVSHD
ncbi:MAG: sensor histidine kinase [Eubacteriales bacterium]